MQQLARPGGTSGNARGPDVEFLRPGSSGPPCGGLRPEGRSRDVHDKYLSRKSPQSLSSLRWNLFYRFLLPRLRPQLDFWIITVCAGVARQPFAASGPLRIPYGLRTSQRAATSPPLRRISAFIRSGLHSHADHRTVLRSRPAAPDNRVVVTSPRLGFDYRCHMLVSCDHDVRRGSVEELPKILECVLHTAPPPRGFGEGHMRAIVIL